MRKMREQTYALQTTRLLSDSWDKTESYVYNKDMEMMSYVHDYPVTSWIIASKDARLAYDSFLARENLRKQGLSIFVKGTPDSWWTQRRPPLFYARNDSRLIRSVSEPPTPIQESILQSAPIASRSLKNEQLHAIFDAVSKPIDNQEFGQGSDAEATTQKLVQREPVMPPAPPYPKNDLPELVLATFREKRRAALRGSHKDYLWDMPWAADLPTLWDDTINPKGSFLL